MADGTVRTQLESVKAFAAHSAGSRLEPFTLRRRELQAKDILIEILWCGVCHADLHLVRNEVRDAIPVSYPFVPGHEIVGRVTATGASAGKFKVGDIAAVPAICDSCRTCENCVRGLEQYCIYTPVFTHNFPDKFLPGQPTYGGYSQRIVIDERYAGKVPANLNLAAAAPLLCAGITMYSPLRHVNVQPGHKVGVVGLGGLGHLGVRLARAMGAEVTVITSSPAKAEDAKRLGAHQVVMSNEADQMAKQRGSFHVILDTVSVDHNIAPYLTLLRLDGSLAILGWPVLPVPVPALAVQLPRRHVFGSFIGSPAEIQELLDFAGKHNVVADVETIRIDQIEVAYERMLRGDVKYRFVIDMSSLR